MALMNTIHKTDSNVEEKKGYKKFAGDAER